MPPSARRARNALHCVDVRVQSLLMSGSFVLVDDALTSHTVHNRDSGLVRSLGSFFVPTGDRGHDFFEVGPHHRAAAHVVLATTLRGAGSLSSLRGIGHVRRVSTSA